MAKFNEQLWENKNEKREVVGKESAIVLKQFLEAHKNDDFSKRKLEKTLKEEIKQNNIKDILWKIDLNQVRDLIQDEDLDQKEKAALASLLDKYKSSFMYWYEKVANMDSEEQRNIIRERERSLEDLIQSTKRELYFLQTEIFWGQAQYKKENLLASPEEEEEAEVSEDLDTPEWKITKEVLDDLDKILKGKWILEWNKLTRQEKSLRKSFRKAIALFWENTESSFSSILRLFHAQAVREKKPNPDWDNLIKKDNWEWWTRDEIKKLNAWYMAYFEAHTSNQELANWSQLIWTLESGVLNEGKRLWEVYTESLSDPISKSQWKEAARLRKKADKKLYKETLRRLSEYWLQKSDLAKFDVLVKGLPDPEWDTELEDWEVEKWLLALMTDTNFDGVRSHLDGRWETRWLQVDAAYKIAKNSWLSMDTIITNIKDFMVQQWTYQLPEELSWDNDIKAADFYKWMRSDIVNSVMVQYALMQHMWASASDIMMFWKKAWEQEVSRAVELNQTAQARILNLIKWKTEFASLEAKLKNWENLWWDESWKLKELIIQSQDFSDSEKQWMIQTINEKVVLTEEELNWIKQTIDEQCRDLTAGQRDNLHTQLSSYLLAQMKSQWNDISVNGLWVGVWVPLNTILKGLSLNLWVWWREWKDNYFLGVWLSWNNSIIKWHTWSIRTWAALSTTLWVIPIASLSTGIDQQLNIRQILNRTDATPIKTISFWANVTSIWHFPASRWVAMWYSVDEGKSINEKYEQLKEEMSDFIWDILQSRSEEKNENPDLKVYDFVKEKLSKKFPSSSKEDLEQATRNLTWAINVALANNVDMEIAREIIWKNYAEWWRNMAIDRISRDHGYKLSWVSVGVQFLAGFFPIGTLNLSFTNYKRSTYQDSPESIQELEQQDLWWIWNKLDTTGDKKQYFEKITNYLRKANVLTMNEELKVDGENVEFPISVLWKIWFDVKIKEDLLKYLSYDKESWKIKVPSKFWFRILEEARTQGSSTILNIGWENSRGMVVLTEQKLLEAAKWVDYTAEKREESLKAQFTKFIQANNLNDLTVLVESWKIKFKQWDEYISVDWGDWDIKDVDRFIYAITWDATNWYEIKREKDTGNNQWFLELVYEKPTSFEDFDLSDTTREVLTLLNDPTSSLVEAISKLDDSWNREHWESVFGFYKNGKDGDTSYEVAATELLKIIPEDDEYEEIRALLSDTSPENKNEKFLVIDRIKAIFATEYNIQDIRSLRSVVRSRGNVYETLKWQDWKTLKDFWIEIDREELLKEIETTEKVLMPWLVGFTAFYRKGKWWVSNEGRWFSMTSLWETRVLWWKMLAIDQTAWEKWFFWETPDWWNHIPGNLEKFKTQKEILFSRIKGITNESSLTEDQIISLLKWEVITAWRKEISLNVEYVCYLMGECANESIGINIENVSISESVSDNVADVKEGDIYTNTWTTRARAYTRKSSFNLWLGLWWKKKEQGRWDWNMESWTTWGGQPDVSQDTGSWSGTTWGEEWDIPVSSGDDEWM